MSCISENAGLDVRTYAESDMFWKPVESFTFSTTKIIQNYGSSISYKYLTVSFYKFESLKLAIAVYVCCMLIASIDSWYKNISSSL